MFTGLLDEACELLRLGLSPGSNVATRAIGYRQTMIFLLVRQVCSFGDLRRRALCTTCTRLDCCVMCTSEPTVSNTVYHQHISVKSNPVHETAWCQWLHSPSKIASRLRKP